VSTLKRQLSTPQKRHRHGQHSTDDTVLVLLPIDLFFDVIVESIESDPIHLLQQVIDRDEAGRLMRERACKRIMQWRRQMQHAWAAGHGSRSRE